MLTILYPLPLPNTVYNLEPKTSCKNEMSNQKIFYYVFLVVNYVFIYIFEYITQQKPTIYMGFPFLSVTNKFLLG